MSAESKILDALLKVSPNPDDLYKEGDEIEGRTKTGTIKYYYKDYIKNLYVDKMYFLHRISYENADTKRLEPNNFGVSKMSYIASPQALLFNTLGNEYVCEILENDALPKGRYKIKYEKEYPVLKNKISIGAYLKNDSDTVILTDLKFLENMDSIKDISEDYLNPEKYAVYDFNKRIAEGFANLFKINLKPNSEYLVGKKKYYKPLYDTYDLFRIFNYCIGFITDYIMNNGKAAYKNVHRVILADILWHTKELQPSFLSPNEKIFSDKYQIEYYGYKEVKDYFESMINCIYESAKDQGINVKFDFEYIPWLEFKDMIKNDNRKDYLKRYEI